MTNLDEIFLVKRNADVAASMRRSPTAVAYCDTKGIIHIPDYVATGPLERSAVEKSGDVIIARYPNDRHFVIFGAVGATVRSSDEVQRMDGVKGVLAEMDKKGMSVKSRLNILQAYDNFKATPLPPDAQRPIGSGVPSPSPQAG